MNLEIPRRSPQQDERGETLLSGSGSAGGTSAQAGYRPPQRKSSKDDSEGAATSSVGAPRSCVIPLEVRGDSQPVRFPSAPIRASVSLVTGVPSSAAELPAHGLFIKEGAVGMPPPPPPPLRVDVSE